ncbi:MAG: hypothetical protein JRI95_04220 [Deltaproteobacteria bacterium]|nr:hypothetical protein [Deltaproteobacteria bacterium]MBW2085942.1 hypothetical protein [Deltaproteobacteria bacterium]
MRKALPVKLGQLELVGPRWKMSGCMTPRVHVPMLGEHNQYVLGELLGLSDEEITNLRQKEIIM